MWRCNKSPAQEWGVKEQTNELVISDKETKRSYAVTEKFRLVDTQAYSDAARTLIALSCLGGVVVLSRLAQYWQK
jgi:hypothetical protein